MHRKTIVREGVILRDDSDGRLKSRIYQHVPVLYPRKSNIHAFYTLMFNLLICVVSDETSMLWKIFLAV